MFDQCCEEDGACPTLSQGKVSGLCEAAPNQCDDEGHLTHLSLSSEGLECKFPEALSKLRTLTRLDLTFNQLDGRCTAFTCIPQKSCNRISVFNRAGKAEFHE